VVTPVTASVSPLKLKTPVFETVRVFPETERPIPEPLVKPTGPVRPRIEIT
jgi:hypothetical protein